jgi:N-acetylneuraminic acid mutarotase
LKTSGIIGENGNQYYGSTSKTFNNKILSIGGVNNEDKETDSFRIINKEGKIKQINNLSYPLEIEDSFSFIHNLNLYVINGERSNGKCFKMNLIQMKEWIEIDQMEDEIYSHCGVIHKNDLFIFGGFSNKSFKLPNISNPQNKWERISDLPFQLSGSKSIYNQFIDGN